MLRLSLFEWFHCNAHTVPLNSNLTHTRDFREGARKILYDTREILYDTRKFFSITPHVYLIYYL